MAKYNITMGNNQGSVYVGDDNTYTFYAEGQKEGAGEYQNEV